MEVKEFFDRYWYNKYLRRFDSYYDFLRLVNRDIFSKIAFLPHKRILIVGLGENADRERFNEMAAEIIAVDISLAGLKSLTYFTRIQMDAHSPAFKSGTFDVVFLRTVMLHCNHVKLIRELARILKQDGHLFWVEPLKHNPFLWLYRCLVSPGRFTVMDYLTFNEVGELWNRFEMVWHREYYLLSVLLLPVFLILPPLRGPIIAFQRFEMLLIRAMPWLRRWCWISCGYAGVDRCS